MSDNKSEESMVNTCQAKARVRKSFYKESHTFRCQLPEGHEGSHSYKDGPRTIIWFGEAHEPDYSTRFRFGHWLEMK